MGDVKSVICKPKICKSILMNGVISLPDMMSYVICLYLSDLICVCVVIYGPRREKTCLRWFAKNTGADQPAHPRSLISAFVFRFLESFTSKLVTSEVSTF